MPVTDTAINGTIFRMVVTSCILPDTIIPFVLIHVRNQIAHNPVSDEANGFPFRTGKKVLKALTKETVMAALLHQIEIQYPHATRKPIKSPNPLRVYA